MNRTLAEPIHHSKLLPGRPYYLKTHWGEGAVLFIGDGEGKLCVEVTQGEFRPPLRRFKKGDTMEVNADAGSWYEIK